EVLFPPDTFKLTLLTLAEKKKKICFTCRTYVEHIFEQDGTDEFYQSYMIYQNLLKLIHEKHNDYKKELNNWLNHIFETNNTYFI
ncbi:hypothetical protein, partial [Phocaeicola vulgatus]|uniref:hypothetical protein n=1 Tax=Phocaeicola vulgatus TaxID=821 RepID=UPI001D00238D